MRVAQRRGSVAQRLHIIYSSETASNHQSGCGWWQSSFISVHIIQHGVLGYSVCSLRTLSFPLRTGERSHALWTSHPRWHGAARTEPWSLMRTTRRAAGKHELLASSITSTICSFNFPACVKCPADQIIRLAPVRVLHGRRSALSSLKKFQHFLPSSLFSSILIFASVNIYFALSIRAGQRVLPSMTAAAPWGEMDLEVKDANASDCLSRNESDRGLVASSGGMSTALASVLIFTIVVDILGNVLVILSVYRNKKLRNAGERDGGKDEEVMDV